LFTEPAAYMATSWVPIARDIPTMFKYNISSSTPAFSMLMERIKFPVEETMRWEDSGEIVYEWAKTAGFITGLNVLNFTDDIGSKYKKATGEKILGD